MSKKKMDKADVIYPPEGKKVGLHDFIWQKAEEVILEKVGEGNKSFIKKQDALTAISLAKKDTKLKKAYIKIGLLSGGKDLVLRIKDSRALGDYVDDYVLMANYVGKAEEWAKAKPQTEEMKQTLSKEDQQQTISQNVKPQEQSGTQKVDTSDMKANLEKALEHAELRERGVKLAEKHLELLNSYAQTLDIERKRGGSGALPVAREILQSVITADKKFNSDPEFIAGRAALQPEVSQALNRDPSIKDQVASLRKRSSVAFEKGMRMTALTRDKVNGIRAVVQQMEFEIENSKDVENDQERLERLKLLIAAVSELREDKVVNRLNPEEIQKDWKRMQNYTQAGVLTVKKDGSPGHYYNYAQKRDEVTDTLRAASEFEVYSTNLMRRFALLMKGEPSKAVSEKIQEHFQPLKQMSGWFKLAPGYLKDHEKLAKACNKQWQGLPGVPDDLPI